LAETPGEITLCHLAVTIKNRYNAALHFGEISAPVGMCRLDGPAVVQGVYSIPLPGHDFGGAAGQGSAQGLSDFVAGPENAIVAKVLRSYLDRTDGFASPLVVYGPPGSGKTHLARGMTDWWRRHYPTESVLGLTGAEFAQAYRAAVADDRLPALRSQCREVALLVIDDLDQLAGKRAAQDELRHTLDALAERQALVLVTAHELPAQARFLQPGLRSRLSAGLNLSLALPGPRTRRVLVKRMALARGLSVPDPTLDKLAEAIHDGAPGLLSALMALEVESGGGRSTWDATKIRKLVAQRKSARMPGLRAIAALTSKYFGMTLGELKSPLRRQALVNARGVAMYLARDLTDKSLEEIGEFFGGRDHTTVLHGCRRTQERMTVDRATRQAVAELKRLLVTT